MDCSPAGSSVHGIFQARKLEWVAICFSKGSSRPRDGAASPALPTVFTAEPLGKPLYVCMLTQSWLTLCNSPPGSSVHGILQARILEWVVTPSSRGSSQTRDRTHIFYISCIGKRVLYR